MSTLTSLLTAAVVGLVGWVFRINSKVDVTAQRHEDLKELIEVMNDNMKERLERIERALNGALRHE